MALATKTFHSSSQSPAPGLIRGHCGPAHKTCISCVRVNNNCPSSVPFCFCLHSALLELPIQASGTEVLGFGQTANASPSGLPFRFYEQSRRAPNDPTANRSVFASVDKVPGEDEKLQAV